jgi:hypothetical protein
MRSRLKQRGEGLHITNILTLGLDFNKNDGAQSERTRMESLKEGHHLNMGGPKTK